MVARKRLSVATYHVMFEPSPNIAGIRVTDMETVGDKIVKIKAGFKP